MVAVLAAGLVVAGLLGVVFAVLAEVVAGLVAGVELTGLVTGAELVEWLELELEDEVEAGL